MKYYIIAGEASGDLHGSNLVKELRKLDAAAEWRGWGGDLMAAAGVPLVKHYRDLAFMGFIEVVKNLPTILANIRFCKEDIAAFAPDVLILVDYPGFNLRIAKWAKQQGYKVVYYISPQVWAWKESRVKLIREVVDLMLVILPFEQDFYKKWNYEVAFVGHPLVQVIEDFSQSPEQMIQMGPAQHGAANNRGTIALLPGSRKQEISVKLPIMLEATRHFPDYNFVVAMAPSLPPSLYNNLLAGYTNVGAAAGQTYLLLKQAKAALVTSGTATLETALFGVPQVVCYKGSAVSYAIAKRLVKIKYISLVNLIMDKPVVTELIQQDLTVTNIVRELNSILHNPEKAAQIKKDYADLKALLQQGGNASARAAEKIAGFLQLNAAQKA